MLAIAPGFAAGCASPAPSPQASEPRFVDEERISDLAVQRALVYGLGRHAVVAARMSALADMECARRGELLRKGLVGGTAEDLTEAERERIESQVQEALQPLLASEAELDLIIEAAQLTFQERWPGLDYATEMRRRYGTLDICHDLLRARLAFDRAFFPDDTSTWAKSTVDAIQTAVPGDDLVAEYAAAQDFHREGWLAERAQREQEWLQARYSGKAREALPEDKQAQLDKALDAATGAYPSRVDEILMALLREFVAGALTASDAVVLSTSASTSGLPDEVTMTLSRDGHQRVFPTEVLYAELASVVQAQDVARTRRFLALMAAARRALEGADLLLPEEVLDQFLRDKELEQADTMFDLETIALQQEGFPSLEAYAEYLKVLECFRRSFEPRLAPTGDLPVEFGAYLTAAAKQGQVQAEVLLIAAYDEEAARWKPDAWDGASRRADRIWKKVVQAAGRRPGTLEAGLPIRPRDVDAFDRTWDQLLNDESEFWDPPVRHGPRLVADSQNKGRFHEQPMGYTDWGRFLEEGRYERLLHQDSVVDRIFDALEPGQVGGPYRGPKGDYIVYLKGRRPPETPTDLGSEWWLAKVQEDFVRRRFQQFCHECLQ